MTLVITMLHGTIQFLLAVIALYCNNNSQGRVVLRAYLYWFGQFNLWKNITRSRPNGFLRVNVTT